MTPLQFIDKMMESCFNVSRNDEIHKDAHDLARCVRKDLNELIRIIQGLNNENN
jgi:hypothetical protein